MIFEVNVNFDTAHGQGCKNFKFSKIQDIKKPVSSILVAEIGKFLVSFYNSVAKNSKLSKIENWKLSVFFDNSRKLQNWKF